MSGPGAPPPAALRLLRVLDGIARLSGLAAAIGVALIAAIMLAEIVARNAFGISLLFTWEYATYLMAAVIFLGAANAARTDFHVRVGIVGEFLPTRLVRCIDLLWLVVAFGLAVFLVHAMLFIAIGAFERNIVSQTPTHTPMAWPYAVVAVGMACFALQILARILRVVLGLPVPRDEAISSAGGGLAER